MSERKRTIAGAPVRSASETADAIVEMVVETLRPSSVDDDIVGAELAEAAGAIRMLVAGKHLAADAIVLVADPLTVEIRVVSGDDALELTENLGKVPGAATAAAWMLHLPAPGPIAAWIEQALSGCEHVTTSKPAGLSARQSAGAFDLSEIDVDALRHVAGEAS